MKVAIYGGSFNPVHFGHIGLAQWVVEHTDIDEVWLMVSPNNPLKSSGELAPEEERLAGVKKAIEGIPGLRASDFEFTLPRPSYTANTLRALKQAFPEHDFSLLIGEDNWQIFDRWREWEFILQHFPILIYPRHSRLQVAGCRLQKSPVTCHLSPVTYLQGAPYFDISSTEIRSQTASLSEVRPLRCQKSDRFAVRSQKSEVRSQM